MWVCCDGSQAHMGLDLKQKHNLNHVCIQFGWNIIIKWTNAISAGDYKYNCCLWCNRFSIFDRRKLAQDDGNLLFFSLHFDLKIARFWLWTYGFDGNSFNRNRYLNNNIKKKMLFKCKHPEHEIQLTWDNHQFFQLAFASSSYTSFSLLLLLSVLAHPLAGDFSNFLQFSP